MIVLIAVLPVHGAVAVAYANVIVQQRRERRERENVYFVTKPNNTCNINNCNKFCDRTPEKANCTSMFGDPNNMDVHETFQTETETRPETQRSETETRPRRWAFCPRRDRDRDVPAP